MCRRPLKICPADIIENIQIIDDYGDKANLTGIKEGEPEKVLNINIKKGRIKVFWQGTVGAGTKGRYGGRICCQQFQGKPPDSFVRID